MRVFRIFSKQSGESAIKIREAPMTWEQRPMSETFPAKPIFPVKHRKGMSSTTTRLRAAS